jgi:hypothetical protein
MVLTQLSDAIVQQVELPIPQFVLNEALGLCWIRESLWMAAFMSQETCLLVSMKIGEAECQSRSAFGE